MRIESLPFLHPLEKSPPVSRGAMVKEGTQLVCCYVPNMLVTRDMFNMRMPTTTRKTVRAHVGIA